MKVAIKKVWADANGNLVADGDESAAVLVAAAGQTIPDSAVEQYKNTGKFFKDAVFDSNAQPVTKAIAGPGVVPVTSHMVDPEETKKREAAANSGPAPQNREDAMPKRKTRGKKPKK